MFVVSEYMMICIKLFRKCINEFPIMSPLSGNTLLRESLVITCNYILYYIICEAGGCWGLKRVCVSRMIPDRSVQYEDPSPNSTEETGNLQSKFTSPLI